MENKPKKRSVVVKAEPGSVVLTPYVMARTANDMFQMADAFPTGAEVPLAKYYVFCASIEIGMKAAILGNDCTSENKKLIKSFGHNLCEVHDTFKQIYGSPWDKTERQAIAVINPYFKKKGLEYFTIDVLAALVNGFSEVPDIQLIRVAAHKVNLFLHSQEFFFDATTSQKPKRGLLEFS